MKYTVTGTITVNWKNTVDARNSEEAEQLAASMAEDGQGLTVVEGSADVDGIERMEQ